MNSLIGLLIVAVALVWAVARWRAQSAQHVRRQADAAAQRAVFAARRPDAAADPSKKMSRAKPQFGRR